MEFLIYLICLLAGGAAGFFVRQQIGAKQKDSAENEAKRVLEQARIEADQEKRQAILGAEAEILAKRNIDEERNRLDRDEIKQTEKRLAKREDNLDRKDELLEQKEASIRLSETKLEEKGKELDEKAQVIDKTIQEQREKLFSIAQLTPEEARAEVIQTTEQEMEHEVQVLTERAISRARENAEYEAQRLISLSINRMAVEASSEHVVSTVELPNDEMKGRIIGREGRNIRSFESATGIDVIVDDTPGVVVLSGFDPVRREIAVRSMAKLVADGRIHPARIEEVVLKTREEMEKHIEETGKSVALELDVRGLKPREIMLLGRLKYRTSYGQNVLDHSREVGYLCGMLAAELNLDEEIARRAGLLHDIGKAVDHDEEGTHPELGAEVAKRSGESSDVIYAINNHHLTTAVENIYATLVQAADAISASRPGARRETLDKYIKRLERLEAIANSYPDIEKAFAIQAGRELRVIAKAEKITDADAVKICRQIAKQIETELTYPGEVKVTLIREFRITEHAR